MPYTGTMSSITVRDVPRDSHKQLRLYCIEQEISLNQLMLRLINEFVKSEKPDIPQKNSK